MGDRSPSPPIDRRVSSLRRRYCDLSLYIESWFEQNWKGFQSRRLRLNKARNAISNTIVATKKYFNQSEKNCTV